MCIRSIVLASAVLAATLFSFGAETYTLKDGTVLEGKVLHQGENQVTIQTPKGISSYRLTDFDTATQEKMAAAAVTALPEASTTDKNALVLQDGTVVTGRVLRIQAGRVSIQTSRGVTAYSIAEFDATTQDRLRPLAGPTAAPNPVKPTPVSTSKPPSNDRPQASERLSHESDPFTLRVAGMVLGAILLTIASIWFIIAGFAESPLWGIALILCNGLAGLAFLVLHFDRAIKPVILYAIGLGVMLASAFMLT